MHSVRWQAQQKLLKYLIWVEICLSIKCTCSRKQEVDQTLNRHLCFYLLHHFFFFEIYFSEYCIWLENLRKYLCILSAVLFSLWFRLFGWQISHVTAVIFVAFISIGTRYGKYCRSLWQISTISNCSLLTVQLSRKSGGYNNVLSKFVHN